VTQLEVTQLAGSGGAVTDGRPGARALEQWSAVQCSAVQWLQGTGGSAIGTGNGLSAPAATVVSLYIFVSLDLHKLGNK
jgi:hypothetical protein